MRLKVQDSDQCFLLQTVRAVLEPVGQVNTLKIQLLNKINLCFVNTQTDIRDV